jgi:hypothetical protein
VLERQAIQPQRNRGAADEGGVVLADQEHGTLQQSLQSASS